MVVDEVVEHLLHQINLKTKADLVDLVVEDLVIILVPLYKQVQVLLVKVITVVLVLILVVVLITTNKVEAAVELVKLATLMEMDLEEMEEICLQNLEPHMVKVESSVVEELVVQELLVHHTMKVDLVEVALVQPLDLTIMVHGLVVEELEEFFINQVIHYLLVLILWLLVQVVV